jgi:hypothetical protein
MDRPWKFNVKRRTELPVSGDRFERGTSRIRSRIAEHCTSIAVISIIIIIVIAVIMTIIDEEGTEAVKLLTCI